MCAPAFKVQTRAGHLNTGSFGQEVAGILQPTEPQGVSKVVITTFRNAAELEQPFCIPRPCPDLSGMNRNGFFVPGKRSPCAGAAYRGAVRQRGKSITLALNGTVRGATSIPERTKSLVYSKIARSRFASHATVLIRRPHYLTSAREPITHPKSRWCRQRHRFPEVGPVAVATVRRSGREGLPWRRGRGATTCPQAPARPGHGSSFTRCPPPRPPAPRHACRCSYVVLSSVLRKTECSEAFPKFLRQYGHRLYVRQLMLHI